VPGPKPAITRAARRPPCRAGERPHRARAALAPGHPTSTGRLAEARGRRPAARLLAQSHWGARAGLAAGYAYWNPRARPSWPQSSPRVTFAAGYAYWNPRTPTRRAGGHALVGR
jgi:hypothetical protein